MREVEIGSCLDHSDHEAIKFKISVKRKSASKTSSLDLRRADCKLLRASVSEVLQENVFAHAGVYECWSLLKHHLPRAQKQATPKCQKSRRQGRKPAWMNRILLLEIMKKRKGVCPMKAKVR